MKHLYIIICGLLSVLTLSAQTLPVKKMEVERLPSLHTPRTYHHTLCVNGEVVVMGGHTDGFIPVKTAEYLQDGEWHEVPMVYTHDDGLALPLSSGRVLLAGGYEKDFGIGQAYSAEMYDPKTHTFKSLSILDTRRAHCAAAEIDSGRVVVSGNWYHDDAIELFDGQMMFHHVKGVAQQRTYPWIFRTDADNVIILGVEDCKGEISDTIVVDRLHGDPFTPPLLRQWRPILHCRPFQSQSGFIGDETKGLYEYLMPVTNSEGQVAIARIQGEHFSLLPTDYPIPTSDPDWRQHTSEDTKGYDWTGRLEWLGPVTSDRLARKAYMLGSSYDVAGRVHIYYVLQIDYAHSPARLTLYYAERHPDEGFTPPVLTADGDLLMAGGAQNSNFEPYSSVLLFRVGHHAAAASSARWPWLLLGLFVVAVLVLAVWMYRRRSTVVEASTAGRQENDAPDAVEPDTELMDRIHSLMEEQQPYLNSELKVSDVAAMLQTSPRYVSDCISRHQNCSFNLYINSFRVGYAQQLMHDQPDIKLSAVASESGFATETSFFRNFKIATGMTPKEWQTAFSG